MADFQSPHADPQTYQIIGAAMEIHRVLGTGFLEAVYRQAFRVELAARAIPFLPEVELAIEYKGQVLDCKYRADFICWGEILIEVKALAQLTGRERSQVINYLKATGYRRALLFNFGAQTLEFERIVLGYDNFKDPPQDPPIAQTPAIHFKPKS